MIIFSDAANAFQVFFLNIVEAVILTDVCSRGSSC